MAEGVNAFGPKSSMRLVPADEGKSSGRKATRRKSRKGVKLGRRVLNKTAAIRDAAESMIRKGKPPRPIEIVDMLAGKGINVSSGQVCVALRGTELALKEHVGAKQRVLVTLPDVTSAMSQVGLEDLNTASEFVRRLGGLERAIAALVTLQQLGGHAPTKEHDRAYPEAV